MQNKNKMQNKKTKMQNFIFLFFYFAFYFFILHFIFLFCIFIFLFKPPLRRMATGTISSVPARREWGRRNSSIM